MQIKKPVNVTNGSAIVIVPDEDLTGSLLEGHIFLIEGENAPYWVAIDPTYSSINQETTVTLTTNYAGTTGVKDGVFTIDFTYPDLIPLITPGDVGTATIFSQAMLRLQALMLAVDPEGFAGVADDAAAAEAAAIAAAASQSAAATSATSAATNATAAATSATSAATSATNAANSATAADADATSAATSATNAAASAASVKQYVETRTLPVVVDDCVDIGTFTISNGAHSMRLSITVPSSGFSVAKEYDLVALYNQTAGAWQIVNPIVDTGVYSSQNFRLEAMVSNNVVTLRIRRTSGTTAGTATILIHMVGNQTTVFAASTTVTNAAAAITANYASTTLTQLASQVLHIGGSAANPGMSFIGRTNLGLYDNSGNLGISVAGALQAQFINGGMQLLTGKFLAFAASGTAAQLYQDADGIVAQRNGAAAQSYRLYNTYTDASNYERGSLYWSSNILHLMTEHGGSGTARAMRIGTSGAGALNFMIANAAVWQLSTANHLLPLTDAGYDIGAAANQARDIYLGRNLIGGTNGRFDGISKRYRDQFTTVNATTATTNLDCGVESNYFVNMQSSTTLGITGTIPTGCIYYITVMLKQDATGGRTLTLPASFKPDDNTAPTWTTTANKMDVLSAWTIDGGTTWYYCQAFRNLG